MIRHDQKPRGIFPNFFLIGAPKSGTTALSEYLRAHPDILFSTPKEPHYFNDDFPGRHTRTLEAYLQCFAGYRNEHAIGEGSALYLKSRSAVPNILRHVPDAKFIVMLRNPVEAVRSFHWQLLYSHEENIEDFEEAWMAQKERARGKRIPRGTIIAEALQYGEVFKYGEQLERLYRITPKEQVKVIFFDDFTADPRAVYSEMLRFLNVAPHDIHAYPPINRAKRMRFRSLEKPFEDVDRLARKLGLRTNLGLKRHLKRLNTKYVSAPPLSPELRRRLTDYYREDILKVSSLTGRNLDRWRDD